MAPSGLKGGVANEVPSGEGGTVYVGVGGAGGVRRRLSTDWSAGSLEVRIICRAGEISTLSTSSEEISSGPWVWVGENGSEFE